MNKGLFTLVLLVGFVAWSTLAVWGDFLTFSQDEGIYT